MIRIRQKFLILLQESKKLDGKINLRDHGCPQMINDNSFVNCSNLNWLLCNTYFNNIFFLPGNVSNWQVHLYRSYVIEFFSRFSVTAKDSENAAKVGVLNQISERHREGKKKKTTSKGSNCLQLSNMLVMYRKMKHYSVTNQFNNHAWKSCFYVQKCVKILHQ